VRQDPRRLGRAQADQPDDAALVPGGTRVVLLVQVQGGHPVPDQHARGQPLAQEAGGSLARAGVLARQDEADHVVRVRRSQVLENAAADHVVRW
jgi:hypothetical protein